jgi:rubrerythrin
MSVGQALHSDHQLARLLQIGIVLEEVVEARVSRHNQSMTTDSALAPEVANLLNDAATESAHHRQRLEELISDLDADSVAYEEIEALVEAQYGQAEAAAFDDVLYDQLCNEETAYKFYDDLLTAIDNSNSQFSIDQDRLRRVLGEIREEEAEGVKAVTELMERID